MSTVEEIAEAIKELSHGTLRNYTKSPGLRIKRTRPRRPPIQIKGKPISETIVEDRR